MRTFSSRLVSREGSPVVDSKALMGVVFSPPVMSHMPTFCSLVSLLLLLFAAVAHAADPYSSTGRTFPVYTCLRMLLLAPHLVPASFFMRDSRLVALFPIS